jgi:hypothetical protein
VMGTPTKRSPRQGTPHLHHLLNIIDDGGTKQPSTHLWLVPRK